MPKPRSVTLIGLHYALVQAQKDIERLKMAMIPVFIAGVLFGVTGAFLFQKYVDG